MVSTTCMHLQSLVWHQDITTDIWCRIWFLLGPLSHQEGFLHLLKGYLSWHHVQNCSLSVFVKQTGKRCQAWSLTDHVCVCVSDCSPFQSKHLSYLPSLNQRAYLGEFMCWCKMRYKSHYIPNQRRMLSWQNSDNCEQKCVDASNPEMSGIHRLSPLLLQIYQSPPV